MNEYWIDFSGYCLVRADSPEEATRKFYEQGPDCSIQEPTFDVDSVEERRD